MARWRKKRVENLLAEEKVDELVSLIDGQSSYAEFIHKILSNGDYKFGDVKQFTRLVYAFLKVAAHHSYNYYSPMKLLEAHHFYLRDPGNGHQPEKDRRVIGNYFLELIDDDEEILAYATSTSEFLKPFLPSRI